MSHDRIVDDNKKKMLEKVKAFENLLARVRTGRASIAILDDVRVDYYGTPTPINQIGTLSTPDPRTIVIAPFEKKQIQAIEKAVMIADLGVQPTNDGNVVRISIPALTEERRKNIVKEIRKVAEDAKIGVRNVRRDCNELIKKNEKSKELSEDDAKRLQKLIQDQTDYHIKLVDERVVAKEKEVMTI